MFNFNLKDYLLNENKYYLGEKIGDLLSAMQELKSNRDGMGTRQILYNSQKLVNQMRKIIHSNWTKKEQKWLEELQKMAIALCKAIDENDNLNIILDNCTTALEDLINKMEVPINNLASQDQEDKFKNDDVSQVNKNVDQNQTTKNQTTQNQTTQTDSNGQVPANPTPTV
jgi:hypothetical protein